jgi:hypothetical protein
MKVLLFAMIIIFCTPCSAFAVCYNGTAVPIPKQTICGTIFDEFEFCTYMNSSFFNEEKYGGSKSEFYADRVVGNGNATIRSASESVEGHPWHYHFTIYSRVYCYDDGRTSNRGVLVWLDGATEKHQPHPDPVDDPDPDPEPDPEPDLDGGEYSDEFARVMAKFEETGALFTAMNPESSQAEADPDTWDTSTYQQPLIDDSVPSLGKDRLDVDSWLSALPLWSALQGSAVTCSNPSPTVSCSIPLGSTSIPFELDFSPYQALFQALGALFYVLSCLTALYYSLGD